MMGRMSCYLYYDILVWQSKNFVRIKMDRFHTARSLTCETDCIIEAVANPDKDRMKHDDTNISLWLQSK